MNKLLLFAVICFVVYLLIKGRGRKSDRGGGEQPPAEAMVSCAHCGLYLPVAESLERDGRRYCCREHLRADAGDRS